MDVSTKGVCIAVKAKSDSIEKANPSPFNWFKDVEEEEGVQPSLATEIVKTTPLIRFQTNQIKSSGKS